MALPPSSPLSIKDGEGEHVCPHRRFIGKWPVDALSMPIKNINDQNRSCHPERSEGSLCPSRQILRFAQDDKLLPILFVKNHHRVQEREVALLADVGN